MNQSTATQSTLDAGAGAATRVTLLETARGVFARNGFDGASVRMITSEAGVNLGAVTYHFGSKRALYDAVLEDGLRPLLDRVRAAAGQSGTSLDRMVAVVEAYFDHLATHAELPHLLLQEIAAGREPPPAVLEIIGEVKRTIAGLQQSGVVDGSVREGHPILMALSVASQPIYLTLIAPILRSVGGVDLADPAARRMVIEHVSDFVRRGLELRTEASA
jgi:AcrR family transcriptional regulator